MKLKIIVSLLTFSSLGLFGQLRTPVEFDENVGIQFMKIKKKIKLDKPYSKDVYSLKFLGKKDISNFGFYGLNMISDLKVIKKEKKNNYFTYSSSFLWKNEQHKKSNTAQKFGYLYEVRKIDNLTVIIDTMIICNIKHIVGKGNRNDPLYSEKIFYKPYAFLMSDYKKRNQTMIDYTFGGHEKLLFPDDSLYVIGLGYNIDYSYSLSVGLGVGLDNPMIHTVTYAFSNSKDISYLKDNILNIKDEYLHASLDSVWIAKSICKQDLYNNNIKVFDLVSSSEQITEKLVVKTELDNMKSEYQNISYWYNWAKDYYKEKLVTSTGYFSLIFKNQGVYYSFKEDVLKSDGNTEDGNDIEGELFYQNENSVRINGSKTEEVSDKLENRFVVFPKHSFWMVSNINAYGKVDGFQVRNGNKNVCGIDNSNIFNLFSVQTLNQYNYYRITAENEKKEKKKKKEDEEREIRKANKKYGKKYVDAALDFDIIVGMHEDLLPYPLKLWSISSRSDFRNGYHLYLYSMLDTSVHLYITVKNHKVSYVSVW